MARLLLENVVNAAEDQFVKCPFYSPMDMDVKLMPPAPTVESTISSLVSEGGVSVIDRWQSQ